MVQHDYLCCVAVVESRVTIFRIIKGVVRDIGGENEVQTIDQKEIIISNAQVAHWELSSRVNSGIDADSF